jgi:hypothetical protein
MSAECDGVTLPTGALGACTNPLAYVCCCGRCNREAHADRFHSCSSHIVESGTRHVRVYGREAVWLPMGLR